jgi:hypothetical protein
MGEEGEAAGEDDATDRYRGGEYKDIEEEFGWKAAVAADAEKLNDEEADSEVDDAGSDADDAAAGNFAGSGMAPAEPELKELKMNIDNRSTATTATYTTVTSITTTTTTRNNRHAAIKSEEE